MINLKSCEQLLPKKAYARHSLNIIFSLQQTS
jgi:hypothetical protein